MKNLTPLNIKFISFIIIGFLISNKAISQNIPSDVNSNAVLEKSSEIPAILSNEPAPYVDDTKRYFTLSGNNLIFEFINSSLEDNYIAVLYDLKGNIVISESSNETGIDNFKSKLKNIKQGNYIIMITKEGKYLSKENIVIK